MKPAPQITNKFIKEYYDSNIAAKYDDYYEHFRWFESEYNWIQYRMIFHTVWEIAKKSSFAHVLEVGPGPGTWTKCFIYLNPAAHYTLVDISEEMMSQNEISLGFRDNLERAVESFENFSVKEESYDIFFSSRVIEYAEDKNTFIKNASASLKKNAKGYIITKIPQKHTSSRLQHRGQISPIDLKEILEKYDCKVTRCVPASMKVRFGRTFPKLNWRAWQRMRTIDLVESPKTQDKVESYLIEFQKI